MSLATTIGLPVFTLTNGAQVGLYFDTEIDVLNVLVRNGPADGWTQGPSFQLSNKGQAMGSDYISTRGGVTSYFAAFLQVVNAKIKELWPALFQQAPTSPLPPALTGLHPNTEQFMVKVMGLKLVNNQLQVTP
jgi:hypothetical protein